VFPDGKGVHVGSCEHDPAFAVAQHADDASTADPFENLVAELLEFRSYERRGLGLLKTQLWMRVYLLIHPLLPFGGCLEIRQDIGDCSSVPRASNSNIHRFSPYEWRAPPRPRRTALASSRSHSTLLATSTQLSQ